MRRKRGQGIAGRVVTARPPLSPRARCGQAPRQSAGALHRAHGARPRRLLPTDLDQDHLPGLAVAVGALGESARGQVGLHCDGPRVRAVELVVEIELAFDGVAGGGCQLGLARSRFRRKSDGPGRGPGRAVHPVVGVAGMGDRHEPAAGGDEDRDHDGRLDSDAAPPPAQERSRDPQPERQPGTRSGIALKAYGGAGRWGQRRQHVLSRAGSGLGRRPPAALPYRFPKGVERACEHAGSALLDVSRVGLTHDAHKWKNEFIAIFTEKNSTIALFSAQFH